MSVTKNPPEYLENIAESKKNNLEDQMIKKSSEEVLDILDDIKDKTDAYLQDLPSGSPQSLSNIENLNLITDVFKQIEEESVKVAELLFDYLITASDSEIMTGDIPPHLDPRINKYVKILNRLFRFSRNNPNNGGFRVISRNMIQDLDKKTYTICMCHDGGMSLDILCDVVNAENGARTPSRSPVRVVVKQAFGPEKSNVR